MLRWSRELRKQVKYFVGRYDVSNMYLEMASKPSDPSPYRRPCELSVEEVTEAFILDLSDTDREVLQAIVPKPE